MRVNVINRQRDLSLDSRVVKKLVKRVIEDEGESCDEVSVYFVKTAEISKLHADYFDDPSPTDCISFPLDDTQDSEGYRHLGEVFVCPAVALSYATKKSLDPTQETLLYIIHGLLHLLGYDDQDPKAKRRMRRAEKRHVLQHQCRAGKALVDRVAKREMLHLFS